MRSLIVLTLVFGVPFITSADTINACTNQSNGNLRVVADLGQCRNNEAPISWESEGPQGPPGPSAEVLIVFDGDGNEVGLPISGALSPSLVHLPDAGVSIVINVDGTLQPLGFLAFEDPNCQGQAFTLLESSGFIIFALNQFFVGSTTTFVPMIQQESTFQTAGCSNESFARQNVVIANEFTGDLGLTFPLPLPLHYGVR